MAATTPPRSRKKPRIQLYGCKREGCPNKFRRVRPHQKFCSNYCRMFEWKRLNPIESTDAKTKA